MPRNFKEAMFFTCLMCGMMVFSMSAWNLWLVGHLSLENILGGFIPGFVCAFILDVLLVGPLAKGLVRKLPFEFDRVWKKIIAISSSMVIGMVSLMSFFGIFMNGLPIDAYPTVWLNNFIAALPINLLVVGPIARLILGVVQAKSTVQIAE